MSHIESRKLKVVADVWEGKQEAKERKHRRFRKELPPRPQGSPYFVACINCNWKGILCDIEWVENGWKCFWYHCSDQNRLRWDQNLAAVYCDTDRSSRGSNFNECLNQNSVLLQIWYKAHTTTVKYDRSECYFSTMAKSTKVECERIASSCDVAALSLADWGTREDNLVDGTKGYTSSKQVSTVRNK